MAQINWLSANDRSSSFIRGDSRTHIDVILTTPSFIRKISNWEIKHDNPYTFHCHIFFNIKGDNRKADLKNK